jgi:hypothetical protein
MTRRLVGAFVAAAFALGFLSGAAGTIVAHDTTTPSSELAAVMADHMADYDMGSMTSGSMTSGSMTSGSMMSGSMMSGSMMSPGSSFGPGMMTGPAASSMPGSQHDLHHPTTSPDDSK